jgi:imidazolonepropionase-like amidohydrolase
MMMRKRQNVLLLMLMLIVGLGSAAVGSGREENDAGKTAIGEVTNGVEAAEPTLAIVGGWLIDGTGQVPYSDAVIILAGDKIQAVGRRGRISIPPNIETIDARGKTILPGIIDAHNHLEGLGLGEDDREFTGTPEKLKQAILQNAQLDVMSGVTTIREMGSSEMVLELRDQIEAVGPRLVAAGPQLVKKNPDAPLYPNFLEFDGPKDARQKVRSQIAKGVDFIKVRLTVQRPLPSLEEMKAIVKAAHDAGLKVAVHTDVPQEEAVRLAIEAGADTLEHSAVLRANSDILFRQMMRQNMILVPTLFQIQAQQIEPLVRNDDELIEPALAEQIPAEWLQGLKQRAAIWRRTVEEWRALRGYDPRQALREAYNTVVRAQSLGLKMAIGPDTGSDLVPHGRIYRDLEFYANAGLPPMQVIEMYSKTGAEALGKEKVLGTIEPGKLADIILVDGDPVFNMSAFRNVVVVIKNGKVVKSPPAP